MANTKTMKIASKGKRFAGYLIDNLIPGIVTIIMTVALLIIFEYYLNAEYYGGYGYGDDIIDYGYGTPELTGSYATIVVLLLVLTIYSIVQIIFYTKSMTIGKAILGMQVVSAKNGKPIGFWKMLFREWFVKSASAYVFYLGYIWIAIDSKNRGWHDLILETYVVDTRASARMGSVGDTGYTPNNAPINTPNSTPNNTVTVDPNAGVVDYSKTDNVPAPSEVPTFGSYTVGTTLEASQQNNVTPNKVEAIETEVSVSESEVSEASTPVIEPTVIKSESNSPSKDIQKVDMSLKKEELLEIAKEHGLVIGAKTNKADIISAIEEKMKSE